METGSEKIKLWESYFKDDSIVAWSLVKVNILHVIGMNLISIFSGVI